MELFTTPEFWSTLATIGFVNLLLSGDNAIVIALAARKLPAKLQRRAIVWGTAGAVLVRVVLTLAVVWLLDLPGLMALGGILLAWIAYRLLCGDETGPEPDVAPISGFWSAMRTIIVADAVMGTDNVLGVAGVAQGNVTMVMLGLALSIPIVVWGSTLILGLIQRFPGLHFAGGALLAWTAATMLARDPQLEIVFAQSPVFASAMQAALVAGVLGLAWLHNRRPVTSAQMTNSKSAGEAR